MFKCSPTRHPNFCIFPLLTCESSIVGLNDDVDSTVLGEGKNTLLRYPKWENGKLFELKKASLSEQSKERRSQQRPLNGSFTDCNTQGKKAKVLQKEVRWAESIPRIPCWRWLQGKFSLNIWTQAPYRRWYSPGYFVGKIASFNLDFFHLMVWGEGTENSTLRNSRENITALPGALMEMHV